MFISLLTQQKHKCSIANPSDSLLPSTVALQKSSAHSYFHLVLRVLNPLLHIQSINSIKIWKYASEYFPGSISKQCTLNNHWKHPWSVQNSLLKREKYVPSVNGFSLNDWHKGYLYCRDESKAQSGAFEDISVAGSYRTAPKTSLKTVL